MKKIFLAIAILFSTASFSQVFIDGARGGGVSPSGTFSAYYNQFLQGGYKSGYDTTNRNSFPSYLRDTSSFLYYTRKDSSFWNLVGGITNSNWNKLRIGGGGGGAGKVYSGYGLSNVNDSTLKADTSVLATINALNLKLNLTDTASMLSAYRTGIASLNADTATLISRFALKLNTSDTAGMILPYRNAINKNVDSLTSHNTRIGSNTTNIAINTSNIALKLNIGDTASMLNNYKSAIITNTAVSRGDYYKLNQLSDSSIAIISYDSTRRDTLVFGSGNGNGMVYATTTGGNINQPSFRTALGLGSAAYKEANQSLRTTDGVIFDYVRLTNGIDGVIAFGNTGKVLYSNANIANTELIYRYSGDGTTSAFDYTVLTGKNFMNYAPTLNGNNIPAANRDSFGIYLGLKSNAYTTVDSTTITNTGGVLRAVGGGSGVSSITGTANQVIASASTGAVTLSLPQSIATTSKPTFSKVTSDSLVKTGATPTDALMGTGTTQTLTSGTYTPTLTPSNNCASVSLINATYQRIGNVVTFNINMSITPTSSGSINTSVQSIRVPIVFSTYNNYYAVGVAQDTVTNATVAVSSTGSANDNSTIVFQCVNNNVQKVSVTFTYTGTP